MNIHHIQFGIINIVFFSSYYNCYMFSASDTDHSFDGGLDDSSQGSTALAQVGGL